ncbi:transposase [Hymenobacter sp. UV11]|uniref:transposase n=1 Tax=Hymenobacter sp. UV11 TaxID=1849735 RepID=UPI00141502B5|nr:transposase [Hymenobacter sp. UV11]
MRQLCQVPGVPASGFYAWQQGPQRAVSSESPAWETALVKVVNVYKRRYGTRRLQVALRQKGHRAGHQRLRTAMRRRGRHALQPKAYTPRTTYSAHSLRCAPNRLPRNSSLTSTAAGSTAVTPTAPCCTSTEPFVRRADAATATIMPKQKACGRASKPKSLNAGNGRFLPT